MPQVLVVALGLALAATGQSTQERFEQGLKAYAAEDYERAMSFFEQAVKAEPTSARYHHWYGRAAGRRAERVVFFRAVGLAGKVRESFERAAELDGSDVEILRDLLEFYLEAPGIVGGGEDKARGIVDRLAQISPAEGHRAQARLLRKRKDYAGAETELRKALELEPHRLSRILELASFLSHRGRHDEADELFALAARISSDAPSYLFARGEALVLAKRDPEQARELLDRYLSSARAPDDPPPSQVRELLKKL